MLPLMDSSRLPRRHYSDNAVNRNRYGARGESCPAVDSYNHTSIRRIQSVDNMGCFQHEASDERFDRHREEELAMHDDRVSDQYRPTMERATHSPKVRAIIRDFSPPKQSRHGMRHHHDIDVAFNPEEELFPNHTYHQASLRDLGYDEQQSDRPRPPHGSRFSSRALHSKEQSDSPRQPFRCQSAREFVPGPDEPRNHPFVKKRVMPEFARSQSEHYLGQERLVGSSASGRSSRRPFARTLSSDETSSGLCRSDRSEQYHYMEQKSLPRIPGRATNTGERSLYHDHTFQHQASSRILGYEEQSDHASQRARSVSVSQQQASSRNLCYEEQSDRASQATRSLSARHFESIPARPIDGLPETSRRMPEFARSRSMCEGEGAVGSSSRSTSRRTMSSDGLTTGRRDNDSPSDDELHLDKRKCQPRSRRSFRVRSAAARPPPPVMMTRGSSVRGVGLRAQASLRSIAEQVPDRKGDVSSETTGSSITIGDRHIDTATSFYTGQSRQPQKQHVEREEDQNNSDGTWSLEDESPQKQQGLTHRLSVGTSNETKTSPEEPPQAMRVLSYGRLEKAVEVAPGIYMRLRDAKETWDAIEVGAFVQASCGNCDQGNTMYCIDSASFVSCPRCKHITEIAGRAKMGGGVGLGFTPSMFRTCHLVGSRNVTVEKNQHHMNHHNDAASTKQPRDRRGYH